MSAEPDGFAVHDADFDAWYRGESPIPGIAAPSEKIPWDIGEPQPAMVSLEHAGQIRGDVLDVGCGTGDNALFLAARGYRVLGVDAAETALGQARRRAREHGSSAEFATADATSLEGIDQRFDTVVDSALYHCLSEEQRQVYSAALHRVTNPGAGLRLFCFADEGPSRFPEPFRVTRANLRANLDPHWNITSIELAHYVSAFTRADLERMQQEDGVAAMTGSFRPDEMRVDDLGRIQIAVWRLLAERR